MSSKRVLSLFAAMAMLGGASVERDARILQSDPTEPNPEPQPLRMSACEQSHKRNLSREAARRRMQAEKRGGR
jgi:hypothetical protein